MAKKVEFRQVSNESGESDKRMNMQEVPPEPAPKPRSVEHVAREQLAQISEFVKDKSDDCLIKDYRMHHVHINLVREISERIYRNKPVSLSDGNIETIGRIHKQLIK